MHRCTRCGKNFEKLDDDVLLSGCPECGNRLFFYIRSELDEELLKRIKIDEGEFPYRTPPDIESIRILSPGVYELNLEALFARDEIIMSIKEEGSYVIHLPSLFRKIKKRTKR